MCGRHIKDCTSITDLGLECGLGLTYDCKFHLFQLEIIIIILLLLHEIKAC